MKTRSTNSENMKHDIVLELFPESKRSSIFTDNVLLTVVVIVLLAFGLWGVWPAKAGEQHIRKGVLCDSSDAITQFFKQWDGSNSKEAITSVNKNVGHMACLFGVFSVEEVARTEIVSNATGVWQLTELKVGSFWTAGIVVTLGIPHKMFTYTFIAEESAGQPI